jgi:hypothetical protein
MTSSQKGKNWTIHIFPAVIHKIVVAARHLLVGGLVLFVRDENEGLVLLKCAVLHTTGYLKIREFRIQSVVGKDPVELEKYLEKKIPSS